MCAPVFLNLLNLLRKGDKMIGKPRILSLFINPFNQFKQNMSTHVRSSISRIRFAPFILQEYMAKLFHINSES